MVLPAAPTTPEASRLIRPFISRKYFKERIINTFCNAII